MAPIAFPQYSKTQALSSGLSYSYVYVPPASPILPSIVFLHGFPSSSYDWRHQINFFAQSGHGILVPDLLGYGSTSRPADLASYKTKNMAMDMVELLDIEQLVQVHLVAHDTGCTLLSRIANYFPQRVLTCSFLDTFYSPPGVPFDFDSMNNLTRQIFGNERFGYISFFITEGAGRIIDEHVSRNKRIRTLSKVKRAYYLLQI